MVQAILKKTSDLNEFVENVKTFITENECPDLSIDLSHLNLMDASKATVLCSTYHWAKYPEGEVHLKTNSEHLKSLVTPLCLGNVSLINE